MLATNGEPPYKECSNARPPMDPSSCSTGTRIKFVCAACPSSSIPARSTSGSVSMRTQVRMSRAYAKTSPSATTRA